MMTRAGRLGLSIQILGCCGALMLAEANMTHWLGIVLSVLAIGGGMALWVEQNGQK